MAIWRKVIDDFEGDIAAKDDDGIEWNDGAKNAGNGGNVSGVLAYRAIKLMFVFAVSRNLSPVHAITVAINPAKVALRFEDEDSPFVDGKAVDLQKFGVGNDIIFDATGVGFGVRFGEITIDNNIF